MKAVDKMRKRKRKFERKRKRYYEIAVNRGFVRRYYIYIYISVITMY